MTKTIKMTFCDVSIVWDPYRQGDIDKLNEIHRAAPRFVYITTRNQLCSFHSILVLGCDGMTFRATEISG